MITVSKGKIFGMSVEVSDDMLARIKASPELASEAMADGATYWHTKILPHHFAKDAHDYYGYAPRTRLYARQKRKGQKPDLVLSGSMRRDLTSKRAISIQGKSIALKMTARVLNFVPNMPQNSADLYIKQSHGRGYPNMKREIKLISDEEREAISHVVTKSLEMKLNWNLGFGGFASPGTSFNFFENSANV